MGDMGSASDKAKLGDMSNDASESLHRLDHEEKEGGLHAVEFLDLLLFEKPVNKVILTTLVIVRPGILPNHHGIQKIAVKMEHIYEPNLIYMGNSTIFTEDGSVNSVTGESSNSRWSDLLP